MKKAQIKLTKNTSNGHQVFWKSVEDCGKKVAEMDDWQKNCPVVLTAKRVGSRDSKKV
jgi:hypothetical protein